MYRVMVDVATTMLAEKLADKLNDTLQEWNAEVADQYSVLVVPLDEEE